MKVKNNKNMRLYKFYICPTPAGGLPIGSMITMVSFIHYQSIIENSSENHSTTLIFYKKSVYKKLGPKIKKLLSLRANLHQI